jgi:hypothetical protein
MKRILLKSAMALGLGIASGVAYAQTEQPLKKPLPKVEQPAQGEGGASPKMDGSAQDGAKTMQPGAATEQNAEGEAGTSTQQQVEGETVKPKTEGEAGMSAEPKTEGTAQGETSKPAEGTAQGEGTEQPTEGQAQTEGTTQPKPAEDTAEKPAEPSSETTASINVTAEQKTEIKQVITETKVEPVRDVDIDISVGVEVPSTIELHPLPPRIVEIVPAYRNYVYFVLADGRIVIVEPDTHEIVVILA